MYQGFDREERRLLRNLSSSAISLSLCKFCTTLLQKREEFWCSSHFHVHLCLCRSFVIRFDHPGRDFCTQKSRIFNACLRKKSQRKRPKKREKERENDKPVTSAYPLFLIISATETTMLIAREREREKFTTRIFVGEHTNIYGNIQIGQYHSVVSSWFFLVQRDKIRSTKEKKKEKEGKRRKVYKNGHKEGQ